MTWIKNSFWPWLKKWWKWILFPVGLLSVLFTAALGSKVIEETTPNRDKLDDIDSERDIKLEEIALERDIKLRELAEQNKDRLENMAEEQEKELLDLADKPIEEVVAWFDKL